MRPRNVQRPFLMLAVFPLARVQIASLQPIQECGLKRILQRTKKTIHTSTRLVGAYQKGRHAGYWRRRTMNPQRCTANNPLSTNQNVFRCQQCLYSRAENPNTKNVQTASPPQRTGTSPSIPLLAPYQPTKNTPAARMSPTPTYSNRRKALDPSVSTLLNRVFLD